MFGKLLTNIYQKTLPSIKQYSSIFSKQLNVNELNTAGCWGAMQVRGNKRYHINKCRHYCPRPKEQKHIKVMGFAKRMSTLHGRKIIMRRILAGRYLLAH